MEGDPWYTTGVRLLPRSAVLLSAALLAACAPRPGTRAAAVAGNGAQPEVELRADERHPPLTLIAREGDPFSAVAVAIAHDGGARESLGLAALLLARLSDAGLTAEAHPSGTGVVLAAAAENEKKAAAFVQAVALALSRPLTSAEGPRILEQAARLGPPRPWASRAEAAVGECVGELGTPGASPPIVAAEIEAWRRGVDSTRTVSFAVVGPRALLDAPSHALLDAPAWPTEGSIDDKWPIADVIGRGGSSGGEPGLSIALRVADGARVLEIARELGDPSGPLGTRVQQMEPSWSLERAVGVARPRGGCVRFDLRPSKESRVTPHAAARAAAVVSSEALLEAGRLRGASFSLDRGALESADPRDAAAVAAWRAFSGKLPAGPPITSVSFASGSDKGLTDETFAEAFRTERAEVQKPTFELVSGTEAGQGQTWLLLGNPCSGITESAEDAGANAVLVRAVSESNGSRSGVRIEPWISGGGVGLLAHSTRLDSGESPSAQAERVADALGRALAGAAIADEAVAVARTEIGGEISAEIPALWATALSALSADHPSLFEPRGTWTSLANLTTHQTELRRRAFVRGPLRLAVLSNAASVDARAVQRTLSRWLAPLRDQPSSCPYATPPVSKPGEYLVDAAATSAGARAVVAVALPKDSSAVTPVEAGLTAHLMNRPNGWLEQALRVPGIAPYAAAMILGGGSASALAVEIAVGGPSAKDAVAQVRALFERLADGAVTAEELAAAAAALQHERQQALLDPRSRAIRLWLGKPDSPFPDLAALRRFHRAAFAPERHIVVMTRAKP